MINIYDSTETNFSHNGICSLDEKRELIKCTIHRKLEGAYEGTLFISKENLKWTEFIEGRILKLPVDINGRTQLFRIFDTSDDFTDLEVYFKHIFFDLDDFFIEDTNIVEKDGRGAINQILNTTVDSHRFTATSDINIINNCRIVDKTVTEAIGVDENCFLNRWGGEIDYDNFKFKINEKIGSDNGYRISLRKNLKAINGDISITEVATKLKIKGYDGIKLDEYLISPLANAYPHFKTRVVKFDDIKVKSDPDNPEEKGYETLQAAQLEMRRRGLELFSKQNIDKPTVNFEIDIDEMREENIEVGVLEVLSIGDIATLELEDFLRSNIEVKQRVIELEFDCIRKINIKVILGESTSTIFKEVSKIESILNDLNDKLEGNSW
ncbi:MAG: phage tail spike protein, partial [Clostridium perfringens]|nr:phage tail spike protein [Clostridium perfringens]